MKGFDQINTLQNRTKYLKRLWRYSQKSDSLKELRKKLVLWQSRRNLENILDKDTDISKQLEEADRFLENHGEDDFFVYINLVSCHYPYNPPEKYREKHGVNKGSRSLESCPLEYGGEVRPEEIRDIERLYNAEVDYLDDKFGELMDKFREKELYEETLIVVFSDHGELLGEKQKFGHHFSTHKNLVNVPLMVKHPEKESRSVEEVTETREVHYQILEEAGIEERDRYRLSENAACGAYERPVIYGDNSDQKNEFNRPLFYVAKSEDLIKSTAKSLEELRDLQENLKTRGSEGREEIEMTVE